MTILQRYISREFLKIFGIVFTGLLCITVLVDFFQNIDMFINFPTPIRWKLLYFALKIPLIIFHITPISMLIALLVTLGIMNHHREITAVRCGGVTLMHLCAPLVGLGAVASLLVFANNEYIVPKSTRQLQNVVDSRIKNRPARSIFRQNRIWFYGERNTIFNIQLLDPVQKTLEGITLYRFDPKGTRLFQRIDARRARFLRGRWDFYHVTIRTFLADGTIKARSFPRQRLRRPEKPRDISQYRERPEVMNYPALSEYVRKLRRSGFNPTTYLVDLQSKLSMPFLSFIVTLLAIPIAFRSRAGSSVVASLGVSLALGLVYYMTISLGISLGHAGKLPPLFAAWLPNLFFLALAGYLWMDLEK